MQGFNQVCGLDEAGRGALAGPLVTGAVILRHEEDRLPGLRDSKELKPAQREALFEEIKKYAVSWSADVISAKLINVHGIQTATYISFGRALKALSTKPDFLLIDYYRLPGSPFKQKSLKFGDKISLSIAAASIVAKVTRDALMQDLSGTQEFENYLWNKNLGYGTRDHKDAIKKYGLSIHHRTCYCKIDKNDQKSFSFL